MQSSFFARLLQYWQDIPSSAPQHWANSCSQHDVVAVRLTSERPGSVIPISRTFTVLAVDCARNVMTHAQKPDFVLLRFKCDGTCAETRFRLTVFQMWWHMRRNQISSYCISNVMADAQKPDFVSRRVHLNLQGRQFSRLLADEVCATAVVMLDIPCSEVVWRVLATHSIRQFPLHFPNRTSPCAITFQLESTSTESQNFYPFSRSPPYITQINPQYFLYVQQQLLITC
jgi:hypothetical protein